MNTNLAIVLFAPVAIALNPAQPAAVSVMVLCPQPRRMFRADRFCNGTGPTAAAGQVCQHRTRRRTAQVRSEPARPAAPRISPPADRGDRREPGGQA